MGFCLTEMIFVSSKCLDSHVYHYIRSVEPLDSDEHIQFTAATVLKILGSDLPEDQLTCTTPQC